MQTIMGPLKYIKILRPRYNGPPTPQVNLALHSRTHKTEQGDEMIFYSTYSDERILFSTIHHFMDELRAEYLKVMFLRHTSVPH